MNYIKTILDGVYIIEPNVFNDDRGYFMESFKPLELNQRCPDINPYFVQDNESKSTYGVLRGLHLQQGYFSQTKLVRVPYGKVLDVVVDLRKDSSSFGKHIEVELSEDNKRQLYIPQGFAHGFVVLSPEAIFQYKVGSFYNKASEVSINPFDEDLNIDWKISKTDMIVSDKDKNGISFKDFLN